MPVSDFTGVYSLDTFDYSNINEKKKAKCVACGKLYEQVRPHQKFCKRDHYLKCVDCGAPVLQKSDRLASELQLRCHHCMVKYRSDRTKQALLDKYGVENILEIPEYRQKAVASINENEI
jgi:DNA-directed RNA polymerase subunit RPC12/RpoP